MEKVTPLRGKGPGWRLGKGSNTHLPVLTAQTICEVIDFLFPMLVQQPS